MCEDKNSRCSLSSISKCCTCTLVNLYGLKGKEQFLFFLLGPLALGYYSVAYQLVMQPFSKINPILTQVSFPLFSVAQDDDEKLKRGYHKGVRLLVSINSPLLIGLAVIAPYLVPVVLGPGWEKTVVLIQILSLFVILRSVGNVSIGLVLAKEKYKWPFYWNLCILIVVPTAIYLATIWSNSVVIVSKVMVAVQFILLAMNYKVYVKRLLGPMMPELFIDFIRPIVISFVMAFFVIFVEKLNIVESDISNIFSMVCVGGVVYLILTIFFNKVTFLEFKSIFSPKN